MHTACLLEESNADILILKEISVFPLFPTWMRYQMEGSLLLPLSDGLVIEQISQPAHQIVVSARATAQRLCCPVCDAASASMHSQYLRTIAYLPHAGQKAILKLRVRRFYCRNPLCVLKAEQAAWRLSRDGVAGAH
jgi:hypothetical protein